MAKGERQGGMGRRLASLLAAFGISRARRELRQRGAAANQQQEDEQHAEIERLRAEGYERTDVATRPLVIVAVVSTIGAALLYVALFGFYTLATSSPIAPIGPATALEEPFGAPPIPRLQSEPRQDLLILESTQTALLHSYGEHPETGAQHIPIELAMEMLAEQGLMTRGDTLAPTEDALTGGELSEAAAAGQQLFVNLGCVGCHRMEADAVGPPLEGVFGREEPLENGETVVADEDYIRRSILAPQEQIVAGYPNAMPSYADRVSDEELAQLVAYIQSLAEAE